MKSSVSRPTAAPTRPLHADYVRPEKESIAQASYPQHVIKQAKSRGVYVILGLFFGLLGIHNFYAGYFGRGVAQLLIVLTLGWFVIGLVIVAFWVIMELITVKQDAAGDLLV
jgi:TM2 domain-containing membrane protein YozV